MKYGILLLILTFNLAPQFAVAELKCNMPSTNLPSLNSFLVTLNSTCERLKDICYQKPSFKSCNDIETVNPDKTNFDDFFSENAPYEKSVVQIGENVFKDIRNYIQFRKDPQIPDAVRAVYQQKLEYLNTISQSKNPLLRNMISDIFIRLETQWLELYGNPLTNYKFSANDQGELLPIQREHENIERNYNAALSVAEIVTFSGVYVLNYLTSIKTRNFANFKIIKKSMEWYARSTRKNFITIGFETFLSLLPAAAALTTHLAFDNRIKALDVVVPSPSTIISFGDLRDYDKNHLSIESAWRQKAFDFTTSIISQATFIFNLRFLSFISMRMGNKLATSLALKSISSASKTNKFLTGIKINGAGLILSLTLDELIKPARSYVAFRDIRSSLTDPKIIKNSAALKGAFDDLIRNSVTQYEAVKNLFRLLDATKKFASVAPQNSTFDNTSVARDELAELMGSFNLPIESQAAIIGRAICEALKILPNQKDASFLSQEQKIEIKRREISNRHTFVRIFRQNVFAALDNFLYEVGELKKDKDKIVSFLNSLNSGETAKELEDYLLHIEEMKTRAEQILGEFNHDKWYDFAYLRNDNLKWGEDLFFKEIDRRLVTIMRIEWKNNPNYKDFYRCNDETNVWGQPIFR